MGKWYEIKALSGAVEVRIFDEIGGWGINVSALIEELTAYRGKALTVQINSPGGSVFDGIALYHFLKSNFPGLRTEVIGVAASIASVIFLAGSVRAMSPGTFLMIHNPWAGVSGDSENLRKLAETLDQIKAELVGIYVSASNLSAEEVAAMMDAETWISADTAAAAGLATEVAGVAVAACLDPERFKFRNLPAALALAPEAQPQAAPEPLAQAPEANGEDNPEGASGTPIQVISAGATPPKERENMDPENNAPGGVDIQNAVVLPRESEYALRNMSGREFLNAITTGTAPMPKEVGEILTALRESNPVRQRAAFRNVQGDYAVSWTSGVGGGWGAEGAAIAETAVSAYPVNFGFYPLQGRFDVTDAALEDNAAALYEALKADIIAFFAEKEAEAMLGTGDGATGVQGAFYLVPTHGQKFDTAAVGAFTKADLLEYLDTMETKYQGLELWMHPTVMAKIVQMKDQTNQIELDRAAKVLNGWKFNLHSSCPAYAVTTGAPLILAADMAKFYGIVQRGGAAPFKFKEVAAPDAFATRMLYAERLDARIVNPKAAKLFRVK